MGKLISGQSEPITGDLIDYIEDWEISHEENYQRTSTRVLAKYGRLSLYDIGFEKRYSIYDEGVYFVK